MNESSMKRIDEGYERLRDAVLSYADTGREARDDWRDAIHDAAQTLDKIVERAYHPDASARAREAMGSLAGIWLDVDEVDEVWTGGGASDTTAPETDEQLHARFAHPGYEYETTRGPRKAWPYENTPPPGDGWERNVDAGHPGEGWERFEFHEESYWRRQRP